ncbi:trypsin-like peptidase domain-containing protein [Candidatus Spongiihabitans sp.]|uniref:trypsin-like peptidase domain-containing protein n=1 Tax=Candidatus Spongiihabitans sp. TaxID=3101308 RepID=UPI003C6FF1A9
MPLAQRYLGFAYNNGEGIAQDKREAMRWYRKAKWHEDLNSLYLEGFGYWYGLGGVKDKRKAMRSYRKAAERGHVRAQTQLGDAYWTGEGVIEDEREAYIWYSIAKANGDKTAADNLREKNWRNYLSQAEIRSGQKEAARRLDAIENREEEATEKSAVGANINLALAPKSANIAERVFENAWRSVVVVHNGDGQGSGVIIRPNIVATNCHVVDAGDRIVVYKADNRRADTDSAFAATISHSDEDKDFCLLDVDGLWGVPITVRKYGTLKVGEDVYGLGAPHGYDLSISSGIVSQLRSNDGNRYIQTDAAISPGSSGGGLFDSEGSLVGIMTSKITNKGVEGIGFAIPADLALGY